MTDSTNDTVRDDRSPPESLGDRVRQHPGLIIGGGLALGLLAGALLPRSARSRLSARTASLAAVAGELGLALGRQALDRASEASREGRERLGELGESAGEAGRMATRRVAGAAGSARSTGLALARKAVKLAASRRS